MIVSDAIDWDTETVSWCADLLLVVANHVAFCRSGVSHALLSLLEHFLVVQTSVGSGQSNERLGVYE